MANSLKWFICDYDLNDIYILLLLTLRFTRARNRATGNCFWHRAVIPQTEQHLMWTDYQLHSKMTNPVIRWKNSVPCVINWPTKLFSQKRSVCTCTTNCKQPQRLASVNAHPSMTSIQNQMPKISLSRSSKSTNRKDGVVPQAPKCCICS